MLKDMEAAVFAPITPCRTASTVRGAVDSYASRKRAYFLFGVYLTFFASTLVAEDFAETRSELQQTYHEKLEALASKAKDQGWVAESRITREWIVPRDPRVIYLFPLEDNPKPAKQLAPLQKEWDKEFQKLRQAQSAALLDIARKAAAAGRVSFAWELVHEAAREDPDRPEPRALLGFSKQPNGGWSRPYTARKLQQGYVWDDRFGWVLDTQLPRLEKGHRYYRGRWITAQQEAAKRSNMASGWHVDTEHYEVITNHSLEAGVELASRLETLRGLWQQVFVEFLAPRERLMDVLAGKARLPVRPVRHTVYYYRNKDEYVAQLQPKQPRIGDTLGIYFSDAEAAYFFAGDEQHPGTVFHEATHQLFQESRPAVENPGMLSNFWLVEGVACYLESLTQHGDYWTLGEPEMGRLPAARQRGLRDDVFVPLQELSLLGMLELQADPRIAPIYSQSAGMSAFLIHAKGGKYREALLATLIDVYAGRDQPDSLARYAKVSFAELDREYHDWLKSMDTE